jgi:hypothetical protein
MSENGGFAAVLPPAALSTRHIRTAGKRHRKQQKNIQLKAQIGTKIICLCRFWATPNLKVA